jgi:predicted nuclease of predicted toxin-antitoxin system
MKLLFDQNLSAKLVAMLADLFPGSAHVRLLGMANADDEAIWFYARRHGYVIVSKDSDFFHRCMRFGHPPKVVWVRLGNCTTETVAHLLRSRYDLLLAFAAEAEAAFLPLGVG